MNCKALRRAVTTLTAGLALYAGAAWSAQSGAAPSAAAHLGWVGRMVTDLDQSVAFYRMLGFTLEPHGDEGWRRDALLAQLFNARGIETRDATLVANSNVSGERFVLRLYEVRGVARQDLSDHTPWEPGATHFGIVVPDAQATWDALRGRGWLKPRSWGGELIAPPGQTKGMLAYMTDPDGLDIELIDQRPGRPSGVSHVGLIVLDADKARAFYETMLGGQLQSKDAPWLSGDFYDSAVGGHGNILRFFNLGFPEAVAPAARMNLELVEFQNRKKPVVPARITDRGLAYLAFEVQGLDALLARARMAGAGVISKGIVREKNGTREVLVRDPDTGAFVLFFQRP